MLLPAFSPVAVGMAGTSAAARCLVVSRSGIVVSGRRPGPAAEPLSEPRSGGELDCLRDLPGLGREDLRAEPCEDEEDEEDVCESGAEVDAVWVVL